MTPEQYAALKANILANPTLVQYVTDGRINALVAAYNAESSPPFTVWEDETSKADVFDAIVWANFTPADDADGSQLFNNRALVCLIKQNNVLGLLSIDPVATGKPNVRAGLSDSLLNVPSAAGGNKQSAGWAAVKDAISRIATRAEKLFATGTGSVASPGTLVFLGDVTDADIEAALRS